MIDTQTDGQPSSGSPPTCTSSTNGTDRGTTFRSTDSTDILFISDYAIYDQAAVPNKTGLLSPRPMNGYLIFPNGRRLRVDNGTADKVEDRNGNETTFTWANGTTTFTDPLNRLIQITPTGISYTGYNGAARQISVSTTALQNALVKGSSGTQPLNGTGGLFSTLVGFTSPGNYNPSVVQSVTLADGTGYKFFYNASGELASIFCQPAAP